MQATYKRRRDEAYADGARSFEALSADVTFRDFVCLYIAEGYKRDRNRVAVGNSDPAVVCLCNQWVSKFARRTVSYALQCHADQDLEQLRAFWGHVLGAAPEAIALQRKSNSNQLAGRTWRSRYGVLTVTANDTLFRSKCKPGWIVYVSRGP
jgi:hypothetical protein